MKKKLEYLKKSKHLIIAIMIILVIVLIVVLNNTGTITRLRNAIYALNGEDIETTAYYKVGAVNGTYVTCQIAFINQRGIENITIDGVKIDGKEKTKVGIDRILESGELYEAKVKIVGEEEQIYTIVPKSQNTYSVNTKIDSNGNENLRNVQIIGYDESNPNVINYYSLDNGNTWEEYVGEFSKEALICGNELYNIKVKVDNITGKTIYNSDSQITVMHNEESLLKATEQLINRDNAYYKIIVEQETYNIHSYVHSTDTIINSTTYGNMTDASVSGESARNMIIVKVDGNLTINSGGILTVTSSQYGGPKGLIVYATGKLTNNGNITMTAKGAKAEGQNVYLWKNQDETNGKYEYISATGGAGGVAITGVGTAGESTSLNTGSRKTGGGASGGGNALNSGAGTYGTSYSGGTGGAGSCKYWKNGSTNWNGYYVYYNGGVGEQNGGAGGKSTSEYIGAGAGNPGVSNGTGGLLVVYANQILNTGTITSNGSNGGAGSYAGGGGSGGGTVNIFYKEDTTTLGTVMANGGIGGSGSVKGGVGGNGTVAIGNISTGTYVETPR